MIKTCDIYLHARLWRLKLTYYTFLTRGRGGGGGGRVPPYKSHKGKKKPPQRGGGGGGGGGGGAGTPLYKS